MAAFILYRGNIKMDLVKIRQRAYELMGKRKAHLEREVGGIYYHGQRTAKIAITLRKHILPDDKSKDDLIRAAAYFHDCAKGIETHSTYGTAVARKALEDLTTEDELDFICHLIGKHQFRRNNDENTSDYVKILQDADLLDHFGVYEIWMNIQYSAHTNGSMEDTMKFYEEHHNAFVEKNRKFINYDISKRIYDEKIEFEKRYIERFKIEGSGGICLDIKK